MKITIFQQEGFPSRYLSVDPEQMFENHPEITWVKQNIDDILGNGVIGDIFVNAHGECYPAILEDRIYEFFCEGGGFLHIGGRPFETAYKMQDGTWVPHERTLGDIRDHKGFGPLNEKIDYFRAKLGFTSYALPYPADSLAGCKIKFDQRMVNCHDITDGLYDRSLNLATTLQMRVLKPELDLNDHRAYQARPIVRETLFPGALYAPTGMRLSNMLQFTKSWGNPYIKDQSKVLKPWVIYNGIVNKKLPDELLDAMVLFLECPVFIKEIVLDSASLHEGENCMPNLVLTDDLPKDWSICAMSASMSAKNIKNHSTPIFNHKKVFNNNEPFTYSVSYAKEALLIVVRFEILDEKGCVRDFCETGVVCWNQDLLKNAVKITPNGKYFNIQDENHERSSCWITGTNWQDRHLFAFSFHNPNPWRIANDALDMAETGVKFVRPHYFMPGWFRAVPGKVYEELFEDFYDSFETGPEISERHMRALEAHVMIFGALGLVYMPSVYTSLGGVMGSPSHWMGTSRLFKVRWQIENQKIFARQIMDRFGDIPCISWDLINEPDTGMDIAGAWLSEHKEIWGRTGQMVGIGCIGFTDNLLLGESADWHSIHGKTGNCYHSGKPFLLQEAHYPVPSTYQGEDELEDTLNSCFANMLRDGGAGIMPWNWNMSFMNWRFRGGWVDFWDLHLGICTHADSTPRRGKSILRNWETLLSDLSFDQSADSQVVFVYPKTCLPGKGSYEYLDLLRDKRIAFCAVNDKDFAQFDLTNTKLVIFPLYGLGYRKLSYERAVQFANDGGIVWAHNENMQVDENGEVDFSRKIPEKSGKIVLGNGAFVWCLGWNIDANYGCPYPDIMTLEGILDELDLSVQPAGILPLKDGIIEFKEEMKRGRHSLLYDWTSLEPWPDANMTEKVQVKSKDGRVVRAWMHGGEVICTDGLTFTSKHDLFLIRQSFGKYYLAGENISVIGRFDTINAKLVSPYSVSKKWEELNIIVPSTVISHVATFELSGWQRMYWLEVTIS